MILPTTTLSGIRLLNNLETIAERLPPMFIAMDAPDEQFELKYCRDVERIKAAAERWLTLLASLPAFAKGHIAIHDRLVHSHGRWSAVLPSGSAPVSATDTPTQRIDRYEELLAVSLLLKAQVPVFEKLTQGLDEWVNTISSSLGPLSTHVQAWLQKKPELPLPEFQRYYLVLFGPFQRDLQIALKPLGSESYLAQAKGTVKALFRGPIIAAQGVAGDVYEVATQLSLAHSHLADLTLEHTDVTFVRRLEETLQASANALGRCVFMLQWENA